MPSSGEELKPKPEMKQGTEREPGIYVERIELGDFLKYKSKLEHLRYNVLTDEADDELGTKITKYERSRELKPDQKALRSDGEHEALYMAKDISASGEKIVGFLSVTFHEGEASVEHFWSAKPEESQHDIVSALLEKVYDDLPNRSPKPYPHLRVEAVEASKRFRHIAARQDLGRFLRISEPKLPEGFSPGKMKPERHQGERGY